MTDHVLAGLIKRRADLIREHDQLKIRLGKIATELGHLDVVIRLFNPEYQEPAIAPLPLFKGERSRAIFEVMRKAGEPLTAAEISRRCMIIHGVDVDDKPLRRHYTRRVEVALYRQSKLGVIRALRREGQVVVWEVAR